MKDFSHPLSFQQIHNLIFQSEQWSYNLSNVCEPWSYDLNTIKYIIFKR